jgi:polyphosphate glucokinase
MKVLVIDIGGTHVKVASTDMRVPLKIVSGPTMDAEQMTQQVLAATEGWTYDCISIGYPGPVTHDRPLAEPHNLAAGWTDFPFRKAFGKPIRFINDAAMQALGGYKGGKMLFLGTGTGMGSAMIFDGVVIPLELAHLPYKNGRTYEEYIGLTGLQRRGKKRWRKSVLDIICRLQAAFICDNVLLGGGNAKLMKDLPAHVILGANSNAIDGGLRLWQDNALPVSPPANGSATGQTVKAAPQNRKAKPLPLKV